MQYQGLTFSKETDLEVSATDTLMKQRDKLACWIFKLKTLPLPPFSTVLMDF